MQVINSYRASDRSQAQMAFTKSGRSQSMQGSEFKKSAGLSSKFNRTRDNSVFDETLHKPPNLDQFGYNLEKHKGREYLNTFKQNCLARDNRIPSWWEGKHLNFKTCYGDLPMNQTAPKSNHSLSDIPLKQTQTQMIENRKKEILPHISYDLDNDGTVGNRDYVLARKFDDGAKNYLTNTERSTAIQAMKNGYEDKYIWGLEAGAQMRNLRVKQVRGVICEAEDFSAVTNTYPQFPLSKSSQNMHKTMTDLSQYRRATEKFDIEKKRKAREVRVLKEVGVAEFKDYHTPSEYNENPKYTATWQRYRDNRETLRAERGLDAEGQDINPEKLIDPSLKWVNQTDVNINDKRKKAMLKELRSFEKNYESHVIGQERIENREDCILRLTFKGVDNETKNLRQVKQKRVQELVNDMTTKFGEQVLGVHGQELPHFADNKESEEYWKCQKGFVENPKIQSQNLQQQTNQIWANNDQMKLSSTMVEPAPVDTFKAEYTKQHSHYLRTGKVTEINHWKNTDKVADPEYIKGFKPVVCWTEQEKNFKCDGVDRPERTIAKILKHEIQHDVVDAKRQKDMEELIIKQAPRCLQADVAQEIEKEHTFQASQMIGVNARKNKRNQQINTQKATIQRLESSPTAAVEEKSELNKTANNFDKMLTTQDGNAINQMYMQTGNVSLMGRMANAQNHHNTSIQQQAPVAKKDPNDNNSTGGFSSMMGSTMAVTQKFGRTSYQGSSSPFKATLSRGMITGVGLFGKHSGQP